MPGLRSKCSPSLIANCRTVCSLSEHVQTQNTNRLLALKRQKAWVMDGSLASKVVLQRPGNSMQAHVYRVIADQNCNLLWHRSDLR